MTHRVRIAALLCLCFSTPLVADDGDLDPSFWADGKMAVPATADMTFGGLATDPEGRMAVAYSYVPPGAMARAAVWRSVDDSSLGSECRLEPYPGQGHDVVIYDVAFDAFGRLLVVAKDWWETTGGDQMDAWSIAAYEYPHCALDPSFGGDGIVTLHGGDESGMREYLGLQPQADGTTLISGWMPGGGSFCRAAVLTLQPSGNFALDFCAVSYGGPFPPDADVLRGRAVEAPNGHVVAVVAGDDFHVVDFNPDGTVAGVTSVAFDLGGGNIDLARDIAGTPEGKVVVVGSAQLSGRFVMTAHAIAVLHWNAAGVLELDPSFSDDGKLTFDFDGWTWNGLESVAAQGDGTIVVAGASMPVGGDYAMAVARLLPDGSFDGDFVPSQPGWRIVDFDLVPPPAHDRAYRVALQNGRIVLAGIVALTTDVDSVGVARLLNSYVFADGFENPQAPGWLWVE